MTSHLSAFDAVCVVRLHAANRPFDGTASVMRAPAVGDVATIVHVLGEADGVSSFVVECVDAAGHTIWLADFVADELERKE